MNPSSHRSFSPSRVFALAWNTLTELTRQKVFYFLLIFALLTIGSSAFAAKLSFEEEFQMLKDVALGSMSIFTSLLAILATAMLLPKDTEDRTLYTILAKPVPRFEYLLGKLCGVLLLLAVSTLVMSALFLAVLGLREQSVLAETTAQLQGATPAELQIAIDGVKRSTFNANLLPGIAAIFIKSALLAAMTLFVSTFSTSSIFTTIVSIAMYFIGHLQSTARDYWLSAMDASWWTQAFLAVVALAFPDLQAFSLVDAVVVGSAIPFGIAIQTLMLGVGYVAVYYVLAVFVFAGREL